MKKIISTIAIVAIIGLTSLSASYVVASVTVNHSHQTVSHSGGTDASGCHHDRKRGGYHCHSPKKPTW